jgi:hypothetical protein
MGGDALSRLEKNTTTNHHINIARNVNAVAIVRDLVGVFVPMGGDALSRNLSLKQKKTQQPTKTMASVGE